MHVKEIFFIYINIYSFYKVIWVCYMHNQQDPMRRTRWDEMASNTESPKGQLDNIVNIDSLCCILQDLPVVTTW